MILKDQIGNSLQVSNPQRIVSLVPSMTELLCDLGLKERLVGRTKFCIHPKDHIKDTAIVGGTKNVNIDKILSLKPDFIVANKEENVKDQIETLQSHIPVWVSDVSNFLSSMEMIKQLGEILSCSNKAESIVNKSFEIIKSRQGSTKQKAIYLIWKDPFMTIGGDTYIHDMMHHLGYDNLFGAKKRYPETDLEVMKNLILDVILLSSEPYPFQEKHVNELIEFFPNTEVRLVDGELFSWYGSRLIHK